MKMNDFDFVSNREDIEWTNTWIDNCKDKERKHWLLVGDSVTRELRSGIKVLVNESVDFIGTSSMFDDPCFYNIFNAFFFNNIYKYTKIIVNIGTKHGFYIETVSNKKDEQYYRNLFVDFLKYLKKYCSDIVIVTGFPEKIKGNLEQWNDKVNEEIVSRNKIQCEVGTKLNCKTMDLYPFIKKENYKYRDRQHFFTKLSNYEIASAIVNNILNINEDKFYKNTEFWNNFFN